MCTVTVVPIPAERRVLLVCNRDEQRTRPPALAPLIRTSADRRAAFPVDPASGGTWLAITDAGLAFCLLNANPSATQGDTEALRSRRSRGLIIPSLLDAHNLEMACRRIHRLDPREFLPFTLLALDTHSIAVSASNGSSLSLAPPHSFIAPLLFTSSGLGDHIVEAPRRTLFVDSVLAARDTAAAAVRFHDHSWPDATHVSVAMSRPDARTVSRSTVELSDAEVTLRYSPLDESLLPAGPPAVCQLAIRSVEFAA